MILMDEEGKMKTKLFVRGETGCHGKPKLFLALWGVAVLALAIALPVSAFCQNTATWTGAGGNSNWSTASNWSSNNPGTCSVPPTSSCNVNIGLGYANVILDQSATVESLALGTGTVTTPGVSLYVQPVDQMPGTNLLAVGNLLTVGQSSYATLTLNSNDPCSGPPCGTAGAAVANSVTSRSSGIIGDQPGVTGIVNVAGNGEQWSITGNLTVGNNGTGTLNVTGGGAVSNAIAYVGANPGSSGTVLVSGPGSTWSSSGNVNIGGAVGSAGTANVTVVDSGELKSGGGTGLITIGATGTVTADGGTLDGDVFNDGGKLDPSTAITINGSYTEGPGGILTFDVSGNGAGQYGQIDIEGTPGTVDLEAGSVIDIDFGFTPSNVLQYTFDFFVGASSFIGDPICTGSNGPNCVTVNFSGLSGDTTGITLTPGGNFVLTVNQGDPPAPVPEPGTWALTLTALIAMAGFAGRRKRSAIPNLVI